MKIKNISIYFILFFFISCSQEEEPHWLPEGIFIEINDDIRQLSLVEEQNYSIDISSSGLLQEDGSGFIIGEIGTVLDLIVTDNSRSYIGGIGGITSCEGISLSIIIIDDEISSEENYKTIYFQVADSLPDVPENYNIDFGAIKNKCIMQIEFFDGRGNTIVSGRAASDFTVNIKKKLGEYTAEFQNIKFETDEESFYSSARIITN